MTIRADGLKLPIYFIVRAQPGGTIEAEELPTYPAGHYYAVQPNAWMDADAWKIYVTECLKYQVHGPSVLILDNFESHVSDEGQRLVAEEACCAVCPLPPNSTSVTQPLNVGAMGTLKAKLRTLWLEEDNGPKPGAAAKRLAMIKRTIKAWNDISEETIPKSFRTALPRPMPEVMEISSITV